VIGWCTLMFSFKGSYDTSGSIQVGHIFLKTWFILTSNDEFWNHINKFWKFLRILKNTKTH